MNYEIIGRSANKRKFLESLMPGLVRQLKLESSRTSVLITLQKDCEDSGLTVPLHGIDMYFVVMNPQQSLEALGITLAHEMVHVAQMAKGTLRGAVRGGSIWSGKRYAKSTPYLDRPWEIQAFAKQEILFRRALLET